jgi:molybdopterin-guanine dinucleotide biosynthesis protein B
VRAVGIVGYKKSGKTTLIIRLSQELSAMGYRVGVLKHVSSTIDFPDNDTSKFRIYVSFACAVSSEESEIILKGGKRIEDILAFFDGDIVLVEGFKEEKSFPKVVCLRNKEEEKELFDGLELCTASFEEGISDFRITNDEHIARMASLIAEKAFKLPRLNCGHCGYESCYELAKEIVRGEKTIDTCVSLNPPISIKIDGNMVPLNPFTSQLMKNIILAMASSLRGFKKGRIEIELDVSD